MEPTIPLRCSSNIVVINIIIDRWRRRRSDCHVEIWLSIRREASFGPQQYMVIQKVSVMLVVTVIPNTIAGRTEIEGRPMLMSSVKASDTSKIQAAEVYAALVSLAPDGPRFNDVVESDHFPKIQSTIAIAVKSVEEVWVVNNPVVATLLEEVVELQAADFSITIGIHRSEERPCQIPKLLSAIVVVG